MSRLSAYLWLAVALVIASPRLLGQDVEPGPGTSSWRPIAAVPDHLLALEPRAAAAALLEANVEPWMRRALRAWLAEPATGQVPPSAGSLTILTSDGLESVLGIRSLAYAVDRSDADAWAVRLGTYSSVNQMHRLPAARARWLAETAWWLGQSRFEFLPEVGGVFAYTVTHDSVLEVRLTDAREPLSPVVHFGAMAQGFGLHYGGIGINGAPIPGALITVPFVKLLNRVLLEQGHPLLPDGVEPAEARRATWQRSIDDPLPPSAELVKFLIRSAEQSQHNLDRLVDRLPAKDRLDLIEGLLRAPATTPESRRSLEATRDRLKRR